MGREIEKRIDDFELRMRLGKLDSLMLFMPTLLGLTYTLLQYAVLGTALLSYFIPVLFFGILMPIYVGYVRGAVKLDSIFERARGWIYFFAGILSYTAIVIGQLAVKTQTGLESKVAYLVIVGGVSTMIYPISAHIGKTLLSWFGDKTTEFDKDRFRLTSSAAFMFSVAFATLADFRLAEIYEGVSYNLYIVLIVLSSAVSSELLARRRRRVTRRKTSLKGAIEFLAHSSFPLFIAYTFLIPFALIQLTTYTKDPIFGYQFVNGLIVASVMVGHMCRYT